MADKKPSVEVNISGVEVDQKVETKAESKATSKTTLKVALSVAVTATLSIGGMHATYVFGRDDQKAESARQNSVIVEQMKSTQDSMQIELRRMTEMLNNADDIIIRLNTELGNVVTTVQELKDDVKQNREDIRRLERRRN